MAKALPREKQIVRTGAVGIVANLLLAAFKAGIGAVSGSIAIVLDAVNNLSDVLSSVITIIGTRIGGKKPDRKHPYGHGRVEYLTATIIALIVLIAGATSLFESVKAIIHGTDTNYGIPAFIVMGVAIVVKLALGRYTARMGRICKSQALEASGADATFDALVTASTLLSALIFLIWKVNLDGWLGALISLVIIKSGVDMVRTAVDDILGHRIDPGLARRLKEEIMAYEGVKGAYDLLLNNYGPDTFIGSVDIELPEDMNTRQIYELTHRMQMEIYAREHVYLVFGVYAVRGDPESERAFAAIKEAFADEKDVLQIHGFYLDKKAKTINFDAVASFDVEDVGSYFEKLTRKASEAVPGYKVLINPDADISD